MPPYEPIDCDFHDELEAASTLQRVVELVVMEVDGTLQSFQDVIVDLGHASGEEGEFMILKSGRRYRLDRIVSIDGKRRP